MHYCAKTKSFVLGPELYIPLAFIIQIIGLHIKKMPVKTNMPVETEETEIVVNKVGMIKLLRMAYVDKKDGTALFSLKEAKDLIEHTMQIMDCCASMSFSDNTRQMFFDLQRGRALV